MDISTLTGIAQLGASGVLLFILAKLWEAYERQNAFIRDLLLQGQAERAVIAERLGMTAEELHAEAAVKRAEMPSSTRLPTLPQ